MLLGPLSHNVYGYTGPCHIPLKQIWPPIWLKIMPKIAQYGFQHAPRGPEDRSRRVPSALGAPSGPLREAQIFQQPKKTMIVAFSPFRSDALLRPQDGPKMAQESSKRSPRGPQDVPKSALEPPKKAPKTSQSPPKSLPRASDRL